MAEIQFEGQKLDLEWVQLIIEAKNVGIKKEEIREFLNSQKEENDCFNS